LLLWKEIEKLLKRKGKCPRKRRKAIPSGGPKEVNPSPTTKATPSTTVKREITYDEVFL